jgi:hypothetical protein
MDLSNLILGTRYLFKYKKGKERGYFRANFLGLVENQVTSYFILNKYENNTQPLSLAEQWYIDTSFILKIELLTDIVGYSCKLPDDVLLHINKYY